MHAYLIIGADHDQTTHEVDQIVRAKKAKLYPHTVASISDVRELSQFTKLAVTTHTCILLSRIDNLSESSANALLKQIEEPQEKITFILTARSKHHILPTILSRCEIITVGKSKTVDTSEGDAFLALSTGERLNLISKITKREDALALLENIIVTLESSLETSEDPSTQAAYLKSASIAHTRINKNGNVLLQLTHLVSLMHRDS